MTKMPTRRYSKQRSILDFPTRLRGRSINCSDDSEDDSKGRASSVSDLGLLAREENDAKIPLILTHGVDCRPDQRKSDFFGSSPTGESAMNADLSSPAMTSQYW